MSQLPTTNWGDFDVDTIGSAVAAHTIRGAGAPTFKPQYTTATIAAYFKRYGAFVNANTDDYHAFSRDLVDADANRATFDRVGILIMDVTDAEEWHIYARGAGTGTMTDFVRARIVKASGVIAIDKMVASVYTAGSGSSASTVTLTAGHSYFYRFRGIAGAVSLKIWDAALGKAGEPTAFNLTPTGLTPTAAGWWALGGRHSTLTGKTAAFNVDAGATNGDVAVAPRTNAERTAWLGGKVMPGESGIRAVLAKMRCTGYDSSGTPFTAVRKCYIGNHGYNSHAQDTPALQHFDNYLIGVPAISREMPAALSGQAVVNIGKMRVSNPASLAAGTTFLLLDGASGGYASTPDSAANSITGDIAFRIRVAPDDWTPAAQAFLLSKLVQAGNQCAYGVFLTTAGAVGIATSPDGTIGALITGISTVPVGATDGGPVWVQASIDLDDGAGNHTYSFATSPDYNPDTLVGTWTALGTTVTTAGVTSIFNSSAAVEIGGIDLATSQNPLGKVYRAQVFNAGVLAVDFKLANVVKGTTSFSAPTGEVWSINGTAKIRQNDDTTPGVRDDWSRNHWLRDGFDLLFGDTTWALHDFLHLVRGRLGNPTCPDLGVLEFPIADMSEFFNKFLVTSRIASGDWINQFSPCLFGQPAAVELVGDRATLVYYANDGPLSSQLSDGGQNLYDVTPTAFVHIGGVEGLITTAVNAGTGEITVSDNHGMLNGFRLRWPSGTPPLGMAINTNYWLVGTTPGTDKFKLSATQGGAAITGGGTATPSGYDSFGYTFNTTLGTVTLVSPPAGRVIGMFLPSADADVTSSFVSDVFNDVFVNQLGLSLNYKDSAAFAAARAVDVTENANTGYFIKTGENETAKAVADKLAAGNLAWYGVTADGLLQVGSRALPSATAVLSFTQSDIKANTLRMFDTIRPVDFSVANVFFGPWFTVGGQITTPGVNITAYGVTSQEAIQGRSAYAPTVYGAAGIPLDDHPDQGDPQENFEFLSYDLGGDPLPVRLVDFNLHTLGLFDFETALRAIEVNIGETISLEFPRLGWKQWTAADPASPDNTATIDSRLAVVIGHYLRVNAAGNTYDGVGLKAFRRTPGWYPTANLN